MPSINKNLVIGSVAMLGALGLWEGNKTTVYADKLANGLPTVCSGNTHPVDGKKLVVGQEFTPEECSKINTENIRQYSEAVLGCITQPMTQNQLDSFTLFAINVGKVGFCKQSRTVRLFNQGKPEEACKAIAYTESGQPNWSTANGKFVQGLHNRRKFEMDWCLRPDAPVQAVQNTHTPPVIIEKPWYQFILDFLWRIRL